MANLQRIYQTEGVTPVKGPQIPFSAGENAGQSVARSLQHASQTAFDIARINQQITDEQGRDEAAKLSATVPASIERLRQGVQQPASDENPYGIPEGEVGSQTLTERFGKGLTEIEKTTSSAVTLPRAGRYLGEFFLRARAGALRDAEALKFQILKSEQQSVVADRLTEFEQSAVMATDPKLRAFTIGEAESYVRGKSGVLTPEQQGTLVRTFRESVHWGVAVRAIDRNPDTDLAPLLKTLSPENGLKLEMYQRAVRERQAKELAESQRALERGMKVYAEGVERYFVTALDAGTVTEEDFDAFGPYISSEKLDAYRKAYRDRQVGGGPGDPQIIRQFKSAVYSADLRTAGDVERISRQLTGAFNAGFVPESQFTPMSSHLQSLQDRFSQRAERAGERAESKAAREQAERERVADQVYAETRDFVRQQLRTTGGLLADFDAAAEDTQTMALEDLSRETGRGRLQSAAEWWNANRVRYLSRLDSRATTRALNLRQSMSGRIPGLLEDPLSPEFRRGLDMLKASKPAYPSERLWLEDVRRAKELSDLARERVRLQLLLNPPKPGATK